MHVIKLKSLIFRLIIVCLFGSLGGASYAQNNVGIGTNTPDASAILELSAPDMEAIIKANRERKSEPKKAETKQLEQMKIPAKPVEDEKTEIENTEDQK